MMLPGSQYPQTPIFARGHSDGMGAWVSNAGSIECSLAAIPGGNDPWKPESPSLEYAKALIPGQTKGKYLSFTVLVQNRIKKSTPMIVVGKAILAAGTVEGSQIIRQGKELFEPDINLDIPNLGQVVGIPTAWVKLTHLNGKEVKEPSRHPEIKDTQLCAVVLFPGDYAIFTVEFRCGGPNITLNFQATRLIHRLTIPAVPFDPAFNGPYKELVPQAADRDEVCEIHTIIDRQAVNAWYKDYETGGVDAHIISHYGEARAKLFRSQKNTVREHLQFVEGML